MSKHTSCRPLLALAALPLFATAQEYNIPSSPVENVLQNRALNPAQQAIGALIEDVCPPARLFPMGTPGNSKLNLSSTQDLKLRCDEMWRNSRDNRDIPNVIAGLQSSANEEDAALGTLSTDLSSGQGNAVGNRLAAIRAGSVGGSVAMLDVKNRSFVLAQSIDAGAPLAAGDLANQWNFYVSGDTGLVDRDATARETGFDGERYGVTAGVDFTTNTNAVLGIAANYAHDDYDLSSASGSLESDTFGVTGYFSYPVGPAGYVDFKAGYTQSDIEQQRNVVYTIQALNANLTPNVGVFTQINQVALSDTDTDEVFVDVVVGRDWKTDTMVIGTWGGTYYGDSTIDGFRERMSSPTAAGSGLALFVDEQSPTSLLAKVGADLRFTAKFSFGVIFPYVLGEYVHEFENDDDPITGGFIDDPNAFRFSMPVDSPDRDFFNFGAGIVAPVSDTGSVFLRYQGLAGYSDLSLHTFEIGARFGF